MNVGPPVETPVSRLDVTGVVNILYDGTGKLETVVGVEPPNVTGDIVHEVVSVIVDVKMSCTYMDVLSTNTFQLIPSN
jgi:hypothetical protein